MLENFEENLSHQQNFVTPTSCANQIVDTNIFTKKFSSTHKAFVAVKCHSNVLLQLVT